MKNKSIRLLIFLMAVLIAFTPVFSEDQAETAEIDTLFKTAKKQVYEEKWAEAGHMFRSISTRFPRSSRRPEARYWLAFCLNKQAASPDSAQQSTRLQSEALNILENMLKRYPEGNWIKPARILFIDISTRLARNGLKAYRSKLDRVSRTVNDSGMKLLALNALMQTDWKKGFAKISEILNQSTDRKLRRQALFILGQWDQPEVRELLEKISLTSSDDDMVFTALMQLNNLFPRRGEKIMNQIFSTRASDQLKSKLLVLVYQNSRDPLSKLYKIAMNEAESEKVRGRAAFWLGRTDQKQALKKLLSVYNGTNSKEIRKQTALSMGFIQSREAAEALIAIYEKEQSRSIKSIILISLGRNGRKEARDFLEKLIDAD